MSVPSFAPPTFLLVAGEASADLHGARLIEAIARRHPDARFVGMGGPLMQAAGLEPLYDAREIAVMGFVEVLPKLVRILGVMEGLARWAHAHKPSAAILIDAPDFNLRLAARLQEVGIPISYYIAPMAWAWREGRVKTLRQRVDKLLCIYPFEEEWFRRRGVPAVFVGNPLFEDPRLLHAPSREEARKELGLSGDTKVLALLPGSRKAEIEKVLPDLVEAAERITASRPGLQVVLPVAHTLDRQEIEAHFTSRKLRPLLVDRTALALGAADAVAVCSGTATLETALAGRPMVVVFRGSPTSYWLAQRFVRLERYSIVNILAGREVVPELIQDDFTPEALVAKLQPLLDDGPEREEMLEALATIRVELGGPGASERAADEVLATLRGPTLALA